MGMLSLICWIDFNAEAEAEAISNANDDYGLLNANC